MLISCICLYLIKEEVFESQIHMNVVRNRFKTFLKHKTARLSILSLICILFCEFLMYFFVFVCILLLFYLELLSIDNQYIHVCITVILTKSRQITHFKSPKWIFSTKSHFLYYMFCTKIRKIAIF